MSMIKMEIIIILALVVGLGIILFIILRKGQKQVFTCRWCNYNGEVRNGTFDITASIIFILLFFCGILPAILFAYYVTNQKECPNCKAKVPLSKLGY